MKDLFYKIARIPQYGETDCVQASASTLLSYYGIQKSVDQIKIDVPEFVNAAGEPQGTSVGHIAGYFLDLGFAVTVHTSDIDLMDATWHALSSQELIPLITERYVHMRHAIYGADALEVVADGFTSFIKKGGEILFPVVDEQYLYSLLEKGPYYIVLNYQYAFVKPKYNYNLVTKQLEAAPVEGLPTTHAMVVAGYKDHRFCLIDPYFGNEDERWIDANRVVGAYYLGDLNIDPILITLQSKP